MATEPVFTLEDLRAAKFARVPLAVVGHPVAHSLSPRMHNAAFGALHHFADWHYEKFDVLPEALPAALAAFAERGFLGINLTVPHKVLAVSEVTDIDPVARAAGAVNTLLRTATGWKGFNTDGYGLAIGVRENLGYELGGHPVILLGSGGAARGAAVECLARGCASLTIGSRTAATRDALIADLRPLAGAIPLRGFELAAPPADLPAGALVINATSAGLKLGEAPPIDLRSIGCPLGVYDMIYNPPQTALLAAATQLGRPAANGLSMLVHQGARALEIWSGVPAMITAPLMAAALR
jgi:shikimate dehydrogenase